MNDLMSLGIHRLWKDYFVRSIDPGVKRVSRNPSTSSSPPASQSKDEQPQEGWNILDVAGGTGDIAFRMLDHATLVHNDHHTRVTVADINEDMLAEGRKRSLQQPKSSSQPRPWDPSRLDFLHANAESMPMIASNSVDLYTVAFGIRNFTDKPAALREAYRVLKPGGVFACLEFSKVNRRVPFFEAIYKRWSFGVIPLIGQVVAGDRDSYQYLVESIERFPSQPEWRDMIRDAGFLIPAFGAVGAVPAEGVRDQVAGLGGRGPGWVDLSGGIAAVHKGVKPVESPGS